tara:strand:+ start:185 stop:370 length:186 start_codon:yes stop_codon:yes gene_type:complete
MFENEFKGELKRLRLKRYDVCEFLQCTMPTLKSRLKNPMNFTLNEVKILIDNGFEFKNLIN